MPNRDPIQKLEFTFVSPEGQEMQLLPTEIQFSSSSTCYLSIRRSRNAVLLRNMSCRDSIQELISCQFRRSRNAVSVEKSNRDPMQKLKCIECMTLLVNQKVPFLLRKAFRVPTQKFEKNYNPHAILNVIVDVTICMHINGNGDIFHLIAV